MLDAYAGSLVLLRDQTGLIVPATFASTFKSLITYH